MTTIREEFEKKHKRPMTPIEIQDLKAYGKSPNDITLKAKILFPLSALLSFVPLNFIYKELGVNYGHVQDYPFPANFLLGVSGVIFIVLCSILFFSIAYSAILGRFFKLKDWWETVLSLFNRDPYVLNLLKWLAISWAPVTLIGVLLL